MWASRICLREFPGYQDKTSPSTKLNWCYLFLTSWTKSLIFSESPIFLWIFAAFVWFLKELRWWRERRWPWHKRRCMKLLNTSVWWSQSRPKFLWSWITSRLVVFKQYAGMALGIHGAQENSLFGTQSHSYHRFKCSRLKVTRGDNRQKCQAFNEKLKFRKKLNFL